MFLSPHRQCWGESSLALLVIRESVLVFSASRCWIAAIMFFDECVARFFRIGAIMCLIRISPSVSKNVVAAEGRHRIWLSKSSEQVYKDCCADKVQNNQYKWMWKAL